MKIQRIRCDMCGTEVIKEVADEKWMHGHISVLTKAKKKIIVNEPLDFCNGSCLMNFIHAKLTDDFNG